MTNLLERKCHNYRLIHVCLSWNIYCYNHISYFTVFSSSIPLRMASRRIVQFLKQTSVKGIPRIFRTKSYFLKTVWGVSVICFLSMATYQVVLLSRGYLEYNSVISMTEHAVDLTGQSKEAVRFPDITFCNLNPFAVNTHKLDDIPSLETYHNLVMNKTSCTNCSVQQLKSLQELRVELLTTCGYYIHIGAAKARKISHTKDQLIVSCNLGLVSGLHPRKVPCEGRATVVPFHDYTYFNCYTIKLPPATLQDMYGAAIIVLHLNNYQEIIEQQKFLTPHYIPGQMSGALMALRDPDVVPILPRDAINLPSGYFMTLNLNFIKTNRLPNPYGNCKHTFQMDAHYQQILCFSKCVQMAVLHVCGCVDYTSYNVFFELGSTWGVPACLSVNVSPQRLRRNWECAKKVNLNSTEQCLLSCPTPCEEFVYEHDVSFLLLYAQRYPSTMK